MFSTESFLQNYFEKYVLTSFKFSDDIINHELLSDQT